MDDPLDEALDTLSLTELEGALRRELGDGNGVLRSLQDSATEFLRSKVPSASADDVAGVAAEWAYDLGLEEFRDAFGHRRILEFGNPGGLYELWGLESVVLGGSGFIIDFGDLYGGDFTVWGKWDPAEDKSAFRLACASSYCTAWEKIGLPPMAGDCFRGSGNLLRECLATLLETSPKARALFREKYLDMVSSAVSDVTSEGVATFVSVLYPCP